MAYLKKLFSLQERASARVAVNMCQDSHFKEVALCLEKPTYGFFLSSCSEKPTYGSLTPVRLENPTYFGFLPPSCNKDETFVSDRESLSTYAKMKEALEKRDTKQHNHLSKSLLEKNWNREKAEGWNEAVDKQCQRLTEGLPCLLKHRVQGWMSRIALELLRCGRQQEHLFGVSRYFLMDFIAPDDWTEACEIDGEKLAKRLLRNEQLTLLQRYRIACVYCLEEDVSQLWERLSREEKQMIRSLREKDRLVTLWSEYKSGPAGGRWFGFIKFDVWPGLAHSAAYSGNRAALRSCWRRLRVNKQQEIVFDLALLSVRKWGEVQDGNAWLMKFLSNKLSYTRYGQEEIERFNLPSDYSELLRFFLSEMNDEQQLTFFMRAFQDFNYVLECFADWPHQEDFVPMMNRLWEIAPEDQFGRCLLSLASKYTSDYEEFCCLPSSYKYETQYCDYQDLLRNLWEEMPEEYMRYLFSSKTIYRFKEMMCVGEVLLLLMLKKWKEKKEEKRNEALFKQICCDISPEEKCAMIYSEAGKQICLTLIQEEEWLFLDWLLEECLPEEEIPTFKKGFAEWRVWREFFFKELKENREKLLEDFIQWSFACSSEKIQYKHELIQDLYCLEMGKSYLLKGEFNKVENVLKFFSLPDELRENFIVKLIEETCDELLWSYDYEEMDKIIAWGIDTQDKIERLKESLFDRGDRLGIYHHYRLVFDKKDWEGAELFYEWFHFSPQDIENVKTDTLFSKEAIDNIYLALSFETIQNKIASLLWCLSNSSERIDRLKSEIETKYFAETFEKDEEMVLKFYSALHSFISELYLKVNENVSEQHQAKKRKKA